MGTLLKMKESKKTITKVAKVISITSGKGGVGKTNFTVNLGYELVKKGKKVLLLDADLGLANINVILGFKPKATIKDLLSSKAKIKDVIVKHELGFDILPATSGISEIVELNSEDRFTLLAKINSLSSNYDYVLVDTAAGIGESVMYFNTASEEIIVIMAPEPTSITDAYALIKVLSLEHNTKNFSILVNRTTNSFEPKETYRKLSEASDRFLNVKLKYLGNISEDDSVSEAIRTQKPLTKTFPSSKASRDINKIAENIIKNENKRSTNGGLQFFFKELLKNENA